MKTQSKWILKAVMILGVFLVLAQPSMAGRHFRGGFFVGPVIRPWGWYSPFYYGPYGYYGHYGYPNAGQVKLETNVKDAEVFINGAYAGTAGKLKSMWLRPDEYNLEIRAQGRTLYAERIYVLAGKTLRVHADLRVEPGR
jgi:hypothetical protein